MHHDTVNDSGLRFRIALRGLDCHASFAATPLQSSWLQPANRTLTWSVDSIRDFVISP